MNPALVLPFSMGELEGVVPKTNNHSLTHLKKWKSKL